MLTRSRRRCAATTPREATRTPESQTFRGDNATAFNDAGQEYPADTSAAIYLEESNSFIEEINPGSSLDGTVVFDVPPGTQLVGLRLHDSFLSDEVEVALS